MGRPTVIPLVRVAWIDAHGSVATTYTLDTLPHQGYPMETYGLMLRRDKTGITVAMETFFDDVERVQSYRGVTFIPHGMVTAVEVMAKLTPKVSPRGQGGKHGRGGV
jgi:hypothetical protein